MVTSICLSVVLVIFILISNLSIQNYAEDKTYFNANAIPKNKVALVLGTSKYLSNGNINLYFKYRVDAAVELFKSNKVEFILVSGDNGSKNYDEPSDFKDELVRHGIPEDKIVLDYAGFRTLDSVIRAKKIFGQDRITVVSQEFHNQRAIYIASKNGIDAIGYNAKDLQGRLGLKTRLREYIAKSKVFLDLVFEVQPRYLGERVVIN